MSGGLSFSFLTGADSHICGLASGGQAHCWGYDGFGQLGNGRAMGGGGTTGGYNTSIKSTTPQAVAGGHSFVSISTGNDFFSCGVATGGQTYCWGRNTRIGTGATDGLIGTSIPTAVGSSQPFHFVSSSFFNSLALVNIDVDGDGVADSADNCPAASNICTVNGTTDTVLQTASADLYLTPMTTTMASSTLQRCAMIASPRWTVPTAMAPPTSPTRFHLPRRYSGRLPRFGAPYHHRALHRLINLLYLVTSQSYLSAYTAPDGMQSIGTQAHFSLTGCNSSVPETIEVEVDFAKAAACRGSGLQGRGDVEASRYEWRNRLVARR